MSPKTLYIEGYINIQQESFYSLNSFLSTFPLLENNITQLGNVIILFPFVAILIPFAPKLWESIITSSLLSLIASAVLKKIFSMPRPAAVFDNDSFVIIGQALKGPTSLPSGHSITSFIVITLVLLALMPKNKWHKAFFTLFMLTLGLVIVTSRVAVGAHYPLDVIIGSAIGSILAILGIQIDKKLNWLRALKNNNSNIILIIIILIWGALVLQHIALENLLISYLAMIPLLTTLSLIIFKINVQEEF
ncbi:MAG: phosphatase PAP2 family protein [Winogradskyella sp.]|uniref:phosphatase PAP2 family protein n=1 Tax=Winogradskyella sp. TaxID=1883156 RepID=UPI00179B58E8|nr:phosphatase PAP2 family protein [Winogradskyella sp.]